MTTIYIAGRVTGLPREEVERTFAIAERRLQAVGYLTINPLNIVPADADWQRAMRHCIIALCSHADAIYLLKGWLNSKGARAEHILATLLKLPQYTENFCEPPMLN